MRVPPLLLVAAATLAVLGTAGGQECGTVDRTEAQITTGAAPTRGDVTIDPCGGPGVPPPRLSSEVEFDVPEATAEWGDETYILNPRHPTSGTRSVPGGSYSFDQYEVPAGTTITYEGAVHVRALNDVRIHGTIRTSSPGAYIKISSRRRFLLEGDAFAPATIETLGQDSPIEIGVAGRLTCDYRSAIRADHGDVLISAHGRDAETGGVHLTSTEVRARDGSLAISSILSVHATGGYLEGASGIRIRAMNESTILTDVVVDGGAEGAGIDVYASGWVRLRGRCDVWTGAAPIVMRSQWRNIALTDVYGIYSESGDQLYSARQGVSVVGSTWVGSGSGDLQFEQWGATENDLLIQGGEISTREGRMRFTANGDAAFYGGTVVRAGGDELRVDATQITVGDLAQVLQEAVGGRIEMRCTSFGGEYFRALGDIRGSAVELHCAEAADLSALTLRAEDGDLVIRSRGPVLGEGELGAAGSVLVDADGDVDLGAATITTDDVEAGTSGAIRIRSWAGAEGHIGVSGSTLRTGDGPVASGDIELSIRHAAAHEPTSAHVLPRTVRSRVNERAPTRSRLIVSGTCDLGLGQVDVGAACSIDVGGLSVDFPAVAAKRGGRAVRHLADGARLTLTPSRSGSSRAKFRLSLRADLTGHIDPDGDLDVRLTVDGVECGGSVRLAGGRFSLKTGRGALLEPGAYLSKARARLRGGGRDRASFVIGLAGVTPPAPTPSALTFTIGEQFSVTIPADAFTRRRHRDRFRGNVGGIRSVVVDHARRTIRIKGRRLDLGDVPEGSFDADVSVTLGDAAHALRVRMTRTGRKLRY